MKPFTFALRNKRGSYNRRKEKGNLCLYCISSVFTMWRIRMLVLFMYFKQNSHRYSLGSLQNMKIEINLINLHVKDQQCTIHCRLSGNPLDNKPPFLSQDTLSSYFSPNIPLQQAQTKSLFTLGIHARTLYRALFRVLGAQGAIFSFVNLAPAPLFTVSQGGMGKRCGNGKNPVYTSVRAQERCQSTTVLCPGTVPSFLPLVLTKIYVQASSCVRFTKENSLNCNSLNKKLSQWDKTFYLAYS